MIKDFTIANLLHLVVTIAKELIERTTYSW